MKVQSKLLIKLAFAILLVCGMEMKRFQNTRPSEEVEKIKIYKNAMTFCNIKDPESDEVKNYFSYMNHFNRKDFIKYLDLLLTLEKKETYLSESARHDLMEPLPFGSTKYENMTHLPPHEQDDKSFVKRTVCKYLEEKIYHVNPRLEGKKSQFVIDFFVFFQF